LEENWLAMKMCITKMETKKDNRIENLELWLHRQPKGQRMGDRLLAAKMLLEEHGYVVHEPLIGLVDGLLYGAVPPVLN